MNFKSSLCPLFSKNSSSMISYLKISVLFQCRHRKMRKEECHAIDSSPDNIMKALAVHRTQGFNTKTARMAVAVMIDVAWLCVCGSRCKQGKTPFARLSQASQGLSLARFKVTSNLGRSRYFTCHWYEHNRIRPRPSTTSRSIGLCRVLSLKTLF